MFEELIPEDRCLHGPEDHDEEVPKRSPRIRPSDAARAWLARQDATNRRRALRIEEPAQALGVWRQVLGVGGLAGSDKPTPLGERADMDGQPIDMQVWTWVRSTKGYAAWRAGVLPTAAFEANLAAWLPRTFYSPLPTLCDVELEELAKGRREIEEQVERDRNGDPEGRLRPGLKKLS